MNDLKKALANPVFFVIAYLVFMVATYILPYGGSNSVMIQSTASAINAPQTGHFRFLFWLHFGSLGALCLLTWIRGAHVGKSWLVIFPFIAGFFDLVPGFSLIPLVPTVMHICALVMGARGGVIPLAHNEIPSPVVSEKESKDHRKTAEIEKGASLGGPVSAGTVRMGGPESIKGVEPVNRQSRQAKAGKLESIFCTECGNKNEVESSFCANCGTKLHVEVVPPESVK